MHLGFCKGDQLWQLIPLHSTAHSKILRMRETFSVKGQRVCELLRFRNEEAAIERQLDLRKGHYPFKALLVMSS